jgi:hypothetical protein
VSVRILVPQGRDPQEIWSLHIHAALLEDRCPRCMGELWDEVPDRPGWRRCRWNSYPDGWWRRTPNSWEWKLGMNPHTGEYEW